MTAETAIDVRSAETAEIAATGFDYSQIDEGIRNEVREAARSIHQLSAGVVTGIIAIGKRLIEVKGMLEHGQFSDWIAAEFELSERMAQNYMNVARHYGDGQKRNNISFFNPTVLYLLSAPSTPEEARQEVEERAAAGEKITVATTNEIIASHKPPKAQAEFAPTPPAYAPIWQLEHKISEWLSKVGHETGGEPDTMLANLKLQTGEPLRSGTWLDMLDKFMAEAGIHFRKSDLTQAIANVREQRRQAKRQQEARVVYTQEREGPATMAVVPDALTAAGYVVRKGQMGTWSWHRTLPGGHSSAGPFDSQEAAITSAQNHFEQMIPKWEPLKPAPMPDAQLRSVPADLVAAGYKIAADPERKSWRWEHVSGEVGDWWIWDDCIADARKRIELAPQTTPAPAIQEPARDAGGIITPEWIAYILETYHPDNADFVSALNAATREQLVDALATLSTEDKHHTKRQAAIQARLAEIDASSQPTAQDWTEAIVGLIISPTVDITTDLPNSLRWAIRQASVEQLREALRLLPDDLRKGRGPVIEMALRRRGGAVEPIVVEPETAPDPRLADATSLRNLLAEARRRVNADYARLCGKWVDQLSWFRGTEKMIADLDSLIAILGDE